MALGKNLKKQKLIEPEKKKAKGPNKKVVKKKLIEDKEKVTKVSKARKATKTATKTAKKPAPAKKKVVKKTAQKITEKKVTKAPALKQQSAPKQHVTNFDSELPIYIAKELQELKNSLRKRYQEEVAKMRGLTNQFVIVDIGGELYALDIDVVKEVVPSASLSKTPNTPGHIQGIANVRGSTYVVFDLTKKFKIEGDYISNYLLVVEHNGISAALSLSELPTTRKINGNNISSELHMIENASLDVSYIKGLIQDQDQLIYYLDVIELLKNDKAIVVPDNLLEVNK